jgi:hypothetical protein
MSVKLVHLRLGVVSHVLAYEEAQVSMRDTETPVCPSDTRAPARTEQIREGDLCEVAVQESDVLALMACLHKLASRPGSSAIERDRFLQAVTAVASAPARAD